MITRDGFIPLLEAALPAEPATELPSAQSKDAEPGLTPGERLMSAAANRFITDESYVDRTDIVHRFLELRGRSIMGSIITLHKEGLPNDEFNPETETGLLGDKIPTIIKDRRTDNTQEIDVFKLDAGKLMRRTIHRPWDPKKTLITPDVLTKAKEIQSSPATDKEITELCAAMASNMAFARNAGTADKPRFDDRPNSQPVVKQSFMFKVLGIITPRLN